MFSNKEEVKTVAIYCRVSTTEQADEGYSIVEQERILREWCNNQGYNVFKVYSDRGISGKNVKGRPALLELLSDSEKKEFNMVLTWKINRISRKLADALKIVEELDSHGISFKSHTEVFDNTTPAGKMQFQMIALIGEFERNTIAENVKMGMLAKAKNGEWPGGKIIGYDVLKLNPTDNKSTLVINEKEADTVKFIFKEFSKGKGYKAIANKLNHLGYKTKRGNTFGISAVKAIITNPVFIGKIRYNLYPNFADKGRKNKNPKPLIVDGKHEPIIDMVTWDKVQSIYNSRIGKPTKIHRGNFLLTGILRCPVCGSTMAMSRTVNKLKDGSKKHINYYVCSNWKNKGTAVCRSNGIRADKANTFVFKKLDKILSNDRLIQDVVEGINISRKGEIAPTKKRIEDIDNSIILIEGKLDRLFNALEDGVINNMDFKKRNEKLSIEITELEQEKVSLTSNLSAGNKDEVSPEYVKKILNNFSEILTKNSSSKNLKELLHLLISEITIDKNRDIETIKIKIDYELINYLELREESQTDSSFLLPNSTIELSFAV